MNNQKKINCPTCGKQDTWHHDNSCRPFCSGRCKLIDLGEWASESRKIQGDLVDPDLLPAGDNSANDSGDHFFS